jgi:hypothetical protein
VIYGRDSNGLNAAGDQMWHQDVPSIEGGAEGGDLFGDALAAGDFDGDGRDDLAIGAPTEDVGNIQNAGAVNVIYGLNSAGLNAAGDQMWHQNIPHIEGGAEAYDYFGAALAAGDFDNDGRADLTISVDEAIGDIDQAGAVSVIYGQNSAGLNAAGDQLWHQDIDSIEGDADEDDEFGGGGPF